MKKWWIAGSVAVTLTLLTVAGLFMFSWQMRTLRHQWRDELRSLSRSEQFAVQIADYWDTSWYLIGPGVFLLYLALFSGLSFGLAALARKRESPSEEAES